MVKAGYRHVGRRIKDERLRSELTLAELAKSAGVSASYISLVENGKAIPSLKILDRICTRLSVHLSALFSEDETKPAKGFTVFRRRGHIHVDLSDKRRLRMLLPKTALPLEPVHLTIQPGDGYNNFTVHKGVEFGYVIQGEVEFSIRDRSGAACHTGDSLVYDAMLPHSFVNTGEADAELLLVGMPNLTMRDTY